MAARLSATARIGLALALTPTIWLGGWAGWNCTRIWVPLDVPISLSRGHIRTAEFKVNLESHYLIALEMSWESGFERIPCPDGSEYCQLSVSVVRAPWSLSKDGRVIATGDGEPEPRAIWITQSTRSLGKLHLNRGTYVLDLDVREDQSRLNSHQPSLEVFESGGRFTNSEAQGAYALMALLLMVPVGICTIIRSTIVRRQENWGAFIRSSSLTQPGTLTGASLLIDLRRKPKRVMPSPFSKGGASGLIQAMTYLVQFLAVLLLIIVVCSFLEHRAPHGLPIRVVRPGVKPIRSPGIRPLRIRVVVDGLWVDSKLIRTGEFDIFLRSELTRRPPDWPVYVEGDRDLEFSTVGQAIDAIRAARAEVVLLTPGYKAALGESGLRPYAPTHGTIAK